MEIVDSDYKKLVAYYGVPKSKEESLKELGENILATQLCVCVSGKKLSPGKRIIDNLVRKNELRMMRKRTTSNNVTKKVSSPKRKGSSKKVMKTKKSTRASNSN